MKHIDIWAHRGASGTMPENTIPAFRKAIEMGADGIELDIQLTKDDEIVVCHDETIDRTSNGSGYIEDMTLSKLRQYDFNNGFDELGKVDIPTMEEVLELLKPTDLIINIELKTGVFDYEGIEEKIIDLVHQEGFEDRVIYSSFNHYSIRRIQHLDPQAKTAFLYADGTMDFVTYAKRNRVDAIHPWLPNLRFQDTVAQAHKAGMQVNVWTVNTEEEMMTCKTCGVDALITNYPDIARQVLYGKPVSPSYRSYIDETLKPWLDTVVQDGYFLTEDGLRLHYCKAIHPDEKASIVMVHGFCEFFGKYHETAYRFYEDGYSIYFLELRGYGKSEREVPFEDERVYVSSFDAYVSDLYCFLKKVVFFDTNAKKLLMFAHSMGGAVGTLFLEKYPDIFRAAVLSSPMLQVNYGKVPEAAVSAMAVYMHFVDINMKYAPGQGAFTGEYALDTSSCMDPDRYAYMLEQRKADRDYQTWGGTCGWAKAAREATHTLQHDSYKIKTPILICQAGEDTMVKIEGQDAFHEKVADATISVYPRSKHEIFNATEEIREKYYADVLLYMDTHCTADQPRLLHVVAAVINDHGKYLSVQRGYGEMKGGWEFPGGKIEEGETLEEALKREIAEELAVNIGIDKYIDTIFYCYPSFRLVMHCYMCHIDKGELSLKEAQDARWLSADALNDVEWLPADRLVLERIKEESIVNEG